MIHDNLTNGRGGGIFCEDSIATINDNTISQNYAKNSGAGVFCRNSRTIICRNAISRNSSDMYGGGICSYCDLGLVLDNVFYENSAEEGGGGIYCSDSSTIRGNVIKNNIGCGVICSDGSPTIDSNIISNNYDGGLSCGRGSPTISTNLISDNSARVGGGVYCSSWSSAVIVNNVIAGNSAEGDSFYGSYGGGIAVGEFIFTMGNGHLTIRNNTIIENSAESGGGGIFFWVDTSPTISDCIIWGNGEDIWSCSPTYCCIQDSEEGEGNIHTDPMFVIGPLGEYYLHPDSRCIDTGSQSADDAGLSDRTTQADGTPDTATVDMGYHYPIE